MEHNTIIQDLCWLLLAAGITALVFHKLRLPVILGYLLVGFLFGPHFSSLSPVHGVENIRALSELGIIFLMFYIGLEFNIGKLRKILGPAFFGLLLQTILMVFLGLHAGKMLGWSSVQSLFLGGLLSISSSMVTVNFLKRKGDLKRPYAQLTVGILILEDVLAILLLVLLSGVAVSGHFAWEAVGHATFLVGIFVVAVFVVGKLISPKILSFLQRIGDPETITLFTVAFIFGVSLLAWEFEFSLALGAFLAGAILSKTALAEEIERSTEPLRDVFSALFFVAMGMLIEPKQLAAAWPVIVLLSLLVAAGKFLSCWLGFVLAGQKPGISTRAALPKTQIGEFSFIIAALGMSLGVADSELRAVASGVAFATILATPLLNARAGEFVRFCDRKCPRVFKDLAALYHNWCEILHFGLIRSVFLQMTYRLALRVLINFLLLNAVVILSAIVISRLPFPPEWAEWTPWVQGALFVIPAMLCIPFLVDILRNLDVIVLFISETTLQRPAFYRVSRGIFRDLLTVLLRATFFILFGLILLLVTAPYLPSEATLILFVMVSGGLAAVLWRRVVRFHSRMEGAVLRSMVDQSKAALTETIEEALEQETRHNPWPVVLEEVAISKKSKFVGMKIKELDLRNQTGATIIAVRRSGVCLHDSLPDIPLFPGDRLLLFGEKEQISAAMQHLNQPGVSDRVQSPNYSLEKILIPRDSEIAGLSLKDAALPQTYGITIMGIQRREEKITGPSGREIIEPEDLLFVMGTPEALEKFKRSQA